MTMNCEQWQALLDAQLDGTLPGALRRRADAHRDGCADCAALHAAALELRALREAAPNPALTDAILALTSGPVCERVESLLPERVDGALLADDAALVDAHLEHCASCAALDASLRWLAGALPALAPPAPDATFTAALLAALDDAPRRHPLVDVAARWRRLWQRPRFALEMAYAVTLLALSLTSLPFSPFRQAPGRALSLLKGHEAGLASALPAPIDLSSMTASVSQRGESAREWSGRRLERGRQHVDRGMAAVKACARDLWGDLKTFVQDLRRGDLAAASARLSVLAGDLKRLHYASRHNDDNA